MNDKKKQYEMSNENIFNEKCVIQQNVIKKVVLLMALIKFDKTKFVFFKQIHA